MFCRQTIVRASARKCDQQTLLLDRVTVHVAQGSVTGILGPSGAGKTTALNYLLGKIHDPKRCDGSREVCGRVAYVMTKDAMYPFLTVRETLQLGAKLRMPESLFRSSADSAIESVVKYMHLDRCLDLFVGDDTGTSHNISRGERKRVSIAIELLACPSVLVLDEPTTGIDSRLAYELVALLNNLTRVQPLDNTLTILMSLHQPADRILRYVDELILLKNGSVIFHGPKEVVETYFNGFGLEKPHLSSTADFMLEVACQDRIKAIALSDTSHNIRVVVGSSTESRDSNPQVDLIGEYRKSKLARIVDENLARDQERWARASRNSPYDRASPSCMDYAFRSSGPALENNNLKVSWGTQFDVSLYRGVKRRVRNWKATMIVYLAAIFQAIIFGNVFRDVGLPLKNKKSYNNVIDEIGDMQTMRFWLHGLDNSTLPTDEFANSTRFLQEIIDVDIADQDHPKTRVDPFIDLFKGGVNLLTQSSIALDVANNLGPMSTYLAEVAICYRELMPSPKLAPDDSFTPMLEWKAGDDFSNISLGDDFPDLQTVISSVTALYQIAWSTMSNSGIVFPGVQQNYRSLLNYFLPLALKLAPFATPLMCCVGLNDTFTLITTKYTKTCSEQYPTYDLPQPPQDWQWRITDDTLYSLSEIVRGSLESYQSLEPELNEIRPDDDLSHQRIKDIVNGRVFVRNVRQIDSTPVEIEPEATTTTPPPVQIVDDPIAVMRAILAGSKSVDQMVRMQTKESTDNRRLLSDRTEASKGLASTMYDLYDIFVNCHPTVRKIFMNYSQIKDSLNQCEDPGESLMLCFWLKDRINILHDGIVSGVESVGALLNIKGVILFVMINMGFMAAEVLIDLSKYRLAFKLEADTSLMSSSAHVLANMIVDLPIQIVIPVIFTLSLVIFVGLNNCCLWQLYLAMWLFSWAAYSVCYLIGIYVSKLDTAIIALCCSISIMLIVTNIFIPDALLPRVLYAVKNLSIYRHGYSLIISVIQSDGFDTISAVSLLILGTLARSLAMLGPSVCRGASGKELC